MARSSAVARLHGQPDVPSPEIKPKRICKPPRPRLRFHFPSTASNQRGFLTHALPQGVIAETTVCPYVIITPLLKHRGEKVSLYQNQRVLTHRQSGARICGPATRYELLHIAGALNGLGLDWSRGREAIDRDAAKLPYIVRRWLGHIQLIGKEKFSRA